MSSRAPQANNWLNQIPQAAKDFIDGRRLEEIECIISDMPGMSRGKAMPASKFAKSSQMFLPDSIYYQRMILPTARITKDLI